MKQSSVRFVQGVVIGVLALALLFSARGTLASVIHFSPIKPVAGQTTPLSDEQQGILAVRTAKASVVSIIGSQTDPTSGDQVDDIFATGIVIDNRGDIVTNNHVIATLPNQQYR